jgi:hypothetical protein
MTEMAAEQRQTKVAVLWAARLQLQQDAFDQVAAALTAAPRYRDDVLQMIG